MDQRCEHLEKLLTSNLRLLHLWTPYFRLLILLLAVAIGFQLPTSPQVANSAFSRATQSVAATVETEPVRGKQDAADDAAVWVHPSVPSQSVIIGTDKKNGMSIYELDGNEIQFVSATAINNVDLRYNFPLGGEAVALVAGSDYDNDRIALYKMYPNSRQLVNVAARNISVGTNRAYGACMYHSQTSGKFYFFVNDTDGNVEQWELFDNGNGEVDALSVRTFDVGLHVEGCVADDELGHFYVSEEARGIWKYSAEPEDGASRTQVDSTGSGGHLTEDVEGLTIYYASDGTGYLIASSQGSNEYVVYEREGNNDYVAIFEIIAGNGIDEVTGTDGIDVTSVPLGSSFPQGVFITQDDRNDAGNQNFKLTPWQSIAQEAGLDIDTSWDPRYGSSGTIVGYTFRQGVGGYSGTVDTFLEQDAPNSSRGDRDEMEWDDGSGTDEFSLIRFDDIFGSAPDQVPPGSTIVSASLTYRVYDTGSEAQVNEVLVDWSENVTYNGFGNSSGVQSEDYGASLGSAPASSSGDRTLDVTASLAAWSGDPSANRGWLFRPTGTSGVKVRSSEYGTTLQRPLLTVFVDVAAPDPANTYSFRQGVDGYTGTVDTFLEEDNPNSGRGNRDDVEWDDGNGTDEYTLIRFDEIFGSAPDQIPPGTAIESATLTLRVYDSGNTAQVNEVLVDWSEDVTYNSFGNSPGVQSQDYGLSLDGAPASSGEQDLDVTASLAAWSNDPSANRGWLFRPTGTSGVRVRSSEYTSTTQRPLLTVVVSPSTVNAPPTALDDNYSVEQGTTLTISASSGVLDNDSDSDGDPLTANLVSGPNNGTLNLNGDGSFTYTPDTGYFRQDSFSYRANDGTANSNPAAVLIDVLQVAGNTSPTALDDSYSLDQDTTLNVPASSGVLDNDSDSDGDPLTASLVSVPTNGTLNLNNDGSFTYTSDAGYFGQDSFSYRANDGAEDSNPATVLLTVNQVVLEPGTTFSFQQGVGGYTGTMDTFLEQDVPNSSRGNRDEMEWDDGNGTDEFSLIRFDEIFGSAPDQIPPGTPIESATLSYRVFNTGNAAQVNEVLADWSEDVTYNGFGSSPGVQSEDYGPSLGNAPSPIGEQSMDVTASLAAWSNDPAANRGWLFRPTGTSGVKVRSSEYATAAHRPILTVVTGQAPSNQPPVALAEAYSLDQDTTLVVPASQGVLDNDSDPDGDPLTANLVSGPSQGQLNLASDGSFTYVPGAGYFGTDSFIYQAHDGIAASNPVTVNLTIAEIPDVPEPPGAGDVVLYLTVQEDATAGANALPLTPQDIAGFDGTDFIRYFDGSDVGLGTLRIDAFDVISATEILMSFDKDGTIPSITGTVEDTDIVKFTASSLGEVTAGTFELYFHGRDVGLASNDDDVDAITLLPDGRLLVSTLGDYTVPSLPTGSDKHLMAFTPTSLGEETSGTWEVYFVGTDVELTGTKEDIVGSAVGSAGEIYLTTASTFSVTGLSGNREDVFVFNATTLGSPTTGNYDATLFFDGSPQGLSSINVQGLDTP
ncbi:MAG: phytase [Dehalococcoidia bacterium]